MSFREITPLELEENIFKLLSKDWLLLTTEKDGKANTMTVGWGGIGVMWGKNVVFVVVRPERYTHEILEDTKEFSLSAFTDKYKPKLGFCGKASGRDTDKLAECGFTLHHRDGIPYIGESRIVFNCRKLSKTDFAKEHFLGDEEIPEKWYGGGYHSLYVAEIKSILIEE